MAYGIKWYTEFKDHTELLCRVDIYQNGFIGSQTEVKCSSDPVSIIMNGDVNDPYKPIRKTQAKINLISETNNQFSELYTSDSREFKVVITRDGDSVWSGWVSMENYSEPFNQDFNYPVTVTAYDGLSDLEGKFIQEIDLTEYNSLNGIIALCLEYTDLELNYVDGINIYDNRTSIVDNTLPVITQHYVHKNWVRGKDCEEILTSILSSFSSVIKQVNNKWYILVPNVQAELTGLFKIGGNAFRYFDFNSIGTLQSTSVQSTPYLSDFSEDYSFANTNAIRYFTPSAKEIVVNRDYGYTGALHLFNNSFYYLKNARNYDADTDTYAYDLEDFDIFAFGGTLTAAEQTILDDSIRSKESEKEDKMTITSPFFDNGGGGNKYTFLIIQPTLTNLIPVTTDTGRLNIILGIEAEENLKGSAFDIQVEVQVYVDASNSYYLQDDGTWALNTFNTLQFGLIRQYITNIGVNAIPANGDIRVKLWFRSSTLTQARSITINEFKIETLLDKSSADYTALRVAQGIQTKIVNNINNKVNYTFDCELGSYNNTTTLTNLALQYQNLIYVNDSGTYKVMLAARIRYALATDPLNELKAKLANEMFAEVGVFIKSDIWNFNNDPSYDITDFLKVIILDVDGTERAFEIIKSTYSLRERLFKNAELRELKGYDSLLP